MATTKKSTQSKKRTVSKKNPRVTPIESGKTRKPRTKKAAQNSKASKRNKGNAEIKGVIFVTLGIFLALSFFTEMTGVFGEFAQDLMKGLFGEASAIFFIFVIWTGLNMFVEEKEEKITKKMWLLLAVMVVISMIGALWNRDQIGWSASGFGTTLSRLYDKQVGGVVGGLLYLTLGKLVGVVGAYIVSVAVMLILLILMTEISIEKILKKLTGKVWVRKNSEYDDDLTDEEDYYSDEDEETVGVQKYRHNEEADDREISQGLLNSRTISERQKSKKKREKEQKKEKVIDIPITSVEPFEFKLPESEFADDVAESVDVGADVAEEAVMEVDEAVAVDVSETKTTAEPEREPFRLEDINSGILTELPDENGNFKESNDEEFEPPSMVQMEEKVDPLTQNAIDAGVPLDRAVEVGKRMSHQEVQQAANSVDIMAKESIEATKIINYKLPSVSLLAKPKGNPKSRSEVKRELEDKANKLLETLASFKVDAKILNITQGPSVTRFELQPGFGIKVSKITNLADDIALSLAASGVRIEAPIPGKSAIGIEIPNETATAVPIREVIDTDKFREFKSKTAFALGKDISGNCVIADVASFPHVLIAGATGSGKSVCINSLITSILYKAKPNEVKMIMVDPKMVELGVYNGIPHLLIPVVTDPKHAAGALNWAVAEMKNRYQLMKDNKVRNIQGYNDLMEESGMPENKLPEIVIIIDELADLMLAAKNEVEDAINSLAALARAAGMYLVIATQRPSVDVITGVIKANVPSRISFAVSSQVDSRTILDSMGAEKLLGRGDMLYAPRGANKPMRVQGNFLSDEEIESIISFIKKQYEAEYDESILEHIEREQESREEHVEEETHTRSGEKDSMFYQAAEYAVDSGQASVAMLQRRYKIGYQRAARIIDQLEENRIIGPYEGTKPRQVLISRAELNEMMMNNSD